MMSWFSTCYPMNANTSNNLSLLAGSRFLSVISNTFTTGSHLQGCDQLECVTPPFHRCEYSTT